MWFIQVAKSILEKQIIYSKKVNHNNCDCLNLSKYNRKTVNIIERNTYYNSCTISFLLPTNWSVRSYVVSIDALFINQKDAIFGTMLEANFMYNHQGRIHGKSPYLLETKIVGKSYGSFVTHSRSMGLLHIMRCQGLENFQIQFHFILVIIYFMI